MATKTNEWTFTSDIASQINVILQNRPDLPFSLARVEEPVKGSRKRHDLRIYDRDNKVILTGEVKRPENPDGRSPYQEGLVMDAHDKANRAGVEHFFTWNINKCVLWRTFEKGKPITERYEEELDAFASPIRTSAELEHPRVKDQLNRFITRLLERCARLVTNLEPLRLFPLDDKFVRVWEAGLLPLVTNTLHTINERYEKDKTFKAQLNKWMRDEQGWNLSDTDEEILRDNLERAAKLSCYVLANKIVFSKALRLRFTDMDGLTIKKSVKTGAALKKTLDAYFKHAMDESNDYETVFRGDFGDGLPFLSDAAVDGWRELSEQTDAFDFTQFPYEVIGQIFERIFSPAERHKFGMHYTRSEVVDLINAFCIRDANASVLDPSCGGGTFLVRAYQRKKDLAENRLSHQSLIGSLYGFDISAYPTHLTTINLATRDLIEQANYPLIARNDFLKVNPGDEVFRVPVINGEDEDGESDLVEMPFVDAVVGNPPYVRQEKINEYYGKNYKTFLQREAEEDAPGADLSGRSDILCYFFTHGGAFLNDGGYMGLLTSSTWLDTAYGFRLQKYLLDNYEIIAMLESNREPWFVGARVTTVATILRKQPDEARRNANNVKFVWIKQKWEQFLPFAQDEYERRLLFENLRDRILRLTEEEETDVWRVRVVNQGELYEAGCMPIAVSEAEEQDEEEEDEDASTEPSARALPGVERESQADAADEYTGYKWGIFLRAPEIFFTLFKRGGERFVPLGQIAEVRFGTKTGCDKFFFPRDVTEDALSEIEDNQEFREHYGISRSEAKDIRIVLAGDGSQHLIEAEYLEPEVHSLMEIDSVKIKGGNLARRVLLVSEPRTKLKGSHVFKYIRWGEREGFNEGSTVRARATNEREWYDLTDERRPHIILPKIQQYRHIVCLNPKRYLCNSSLLAVFTQEKTAKMLCALLNSTVVAFFKQFFARPHGREASIQLDVYSAQMMLVPDPENATEKIKRKIHDAFESILKRDSLALIDVDSTSVDWTGELSFEDRQQLDDAVLELLGITNKQEREQLRAELYEEVTTLFRQLRAAEREMQRNRSTTARQGRATAQSIAAEIWESLDTRPAYYTPLDFVPPRVRTETVTLPVEGRARIIPGNMFQPDSVQIGATIIELGDPTRCEFVKELSRIGINGSVPVPVQPEHCHNALREHQKYADETNTIFQDFAAALTADDHMQERVIRELWRKLRAEH
jgi:type I restriction-modification system DNA methylase subunit